MLKAMGGMKMARPPRHGQIKTSTMKRAHMRKHLALMTESAATVADYGGHDASGFDSRGSFVQGGASSGADYQTRSEGDTPDSDSQGGY
jgi:hypothetical protein